MTIVVLWYRERFDELWCAADSRITREGSVATDSGPKILPVPINCYKQIKLGKYKLKKRYSYGFAFAGSTLSALGTHSIVTASTQNLLAIEKKANAVSVNSVAELYKSISDDYIKNIAMRQAGSLTDVAQFFFQAFIFGYCPVENRYKGFGIFPNTGDGKFKMLIAETVLRPLKYHPIGSGSEDFSSLSDELGVSHPNPGVIITLREMLKRETRPDVGGYFQIGIASKRGFELVPILNLSPESDDNKWHFLGWDLNSVGLIDGYRIGFRAFSPDVD